MKKKNQKSRSNKYWLLGTSLVCVLLMIFFCVCREGRRALPGSG